MGFLVVSLWLVCWVVLVCCGFPFGISCLGGVVLVGAVGWFCRFVLFAWRSVCVCLVL